MAQRWADLDPTFTWRRSQLHLLDLAGQVRDERWHLCAPPGSGKTLIGLELARRVDRPTIVLSPTTAIRDQWCAATAMFGAGPGFATSDVTTSAPLLSVTYQLLGNPGSATSELRSAARRLWLADLAPDSDAPEGRVAAVEENDPARARREIAARVRRIRRSLADPGERDGLDFEALVGERTHALLETLDRRGIGCVVLDECHHLLDWWALVVNALIESLTRNRDVAIVGLTATLPDPDSSREAENYLRILGPVDAELHLPAMVAEGGVAPWRDAVRLVPPAPAEAEFIADGTRHLCTELDQLLARDAFVDWAVHRILGPALDEREDGARPVPDPVAWSSFWDRDPLAAAACASWWRHRGLALPAGFDPPEEPGPLTLADRLCLVDTWLHDPDRPCPDRDRDDLAVVLRRYGYAVTSAGVRASRSIGDLICARSDAKGPAAAEVIAAEAARRGDGLRAVVIVERDRASTPPAAARELLGTDAGTTARMLAALCAHPDVLAAGVVAVTARGMWVDAVAAGAVVGGINVAGDGSRWVTTEGTGIPGAVGLVGHGPGWTSARWLEAAEAALECGAVHTMVATRGLVGEGWDCPSLNVLVDCSEAASRTAVTQLRGRVLRRHAGQPEKLASIWDVTVVHDDATGDWERLRRRHQWWWGPADDQVMRGPGKIHDRLTDPSPPSEADREAVNAASLARVADEDGTRAAWANVDPGGDASPIVAVRPRRRRRVRIRSPRWRPTAGGAAFTAAAASGAVLLAPPAVALVGAAGAGIATLVAVGAARGRAQAELDVAAALGDAVLRGLRAVGAVDLPGAEVVAHRHDGQVQLSTTATAGDGTADGEATWAAALTEVVGSLGTPRWMLRCEAGDAWRVPAVVGASREAAEAYADAFRSRFPGARLLRAGTPEATAAVLEARRRRTDEVASVDQWR